jgi:hypothetical protein
MIILFAIALILSALCFTAAALIEQHRIRQGRGALMPPLLFWAASTLIVAGGIALIVAA